MSSTSTYTYTFILILIGMVYFCAFIFDHINAFVVDPPPPQQPCARISRYSYPPLYIDPFIGSFRVGVRNRECSFVRNGNISYVETNTYIEEAKAALGNMLEWHRGVLIQWACNIPSHNTNDTQEYYTAKITMQIGFTPTTPFPQPYTTNWPWLSVGDIMYDIGTWGLYPVNNGITADTYANNHPTALLSGSLSSCTVSRRTRIDMLCDVIVTMNIPRSAMLTNVSHLVAAILLYHRPSSLTLFPPPPVPTPYASRILSLSVTLIASFSQGMNNVVAWLRLYSNRTGGIVPISPFWSTTLCDSRCGTGTTQYSYTWTWNQTLDGRLPLLQSQGGGVDYFEILAGSQSDVGSISDVTATFDMTYIETGQYGQTLPNAQPKRRFSTVKTFQQPKLKSDVNGYSINIITAPLVYYESTANPTPIPIPTPRAWLTFTASTNQYAQFRTPTGVYPSTGIIPIPSGNSDRTLSAWVRLTSIIPGVASYTIFSSNTQRDGCGSSEQAFGYNIDDGFVYGACNVGLAAYNYIHINDVLMKWHHITATYNDATRTAQVYVNGDPGLAVYFDASLLTTLTEAVTLGARYMGDPSPTLFHYWSGSIANFHVYNRILSQREIIQDMYNGKNGISLPAGLTLNIDTIC